MEIKVLDVFLELPYDLTVADDAENWEKDLDSLNRVMREIEERKGFSQSQIIGEQICAMEEWLNRVFGPGSGAKIFEGRRNLKTAYIVHRFMGMAHAIYVPKLLNDAWNNAMKLYGPERVQRKP